MVPIQDPLGLDVVADGATVTVRVSGEVDASTSDDLGRTLRESLGPGVQRLVLDVSGVDFIDSSGLRALVQTHRAVGEHEGAFVLRGPSDTFRRLLDVTGLDEVFTVE